MERCVAYIRVSTIRQGERGVSLQEQRQAITEYARRNGLAITEWFEETETAAKRGRPAFNKLLALLRKGKVSGVVIHKVDRSARNLRDWADLAELMDSGLAVYIAGDNLDMKSRGGRLSADIQAVVASDYIRNLREEIRKGISGRLRQGILPRGAPLGYLDCGSGKLKEIDPVRGPLVRKAFELYASGEHGLRTLKEEMTERGLRSRNGKSLSVNSFSLILNNPFYMGLIAVKKTGETFAGAHEPLISPSLFKKVQNRLRARDNAKERRHPFIFRGMVRCTSCGRSLIGELQRGHTYYRCHTGTCPIRCVREEVLHDAIKVELEKLRFTDEERAELDRLCGSLKDRSGEDREASLRALGLQYAQAAERLMALTDALIDKIIEKEIFNERKHRLLMEQKDLEEKRLKLLNQREKKTDPRKKLEQADMALDGYMLASPEEKRDFLKMTTSNIYLTPNGGLVELSIPFSWVANRRYVLDGGVQRDSSRSRRKLPQEQNPYAYLEELVRKITQWIEEEENR